MEKAIEDKIEVRDLRNGDWFWANKLVLDHPYFTSATKLVYTALAYFSNNNTQEAHPGIRRIAKMMGLSKTTIIRALKKLEEYQFIKIEKTEGQINHYILLKLTDSIPVSKCNRYQKETSKVVKNRERGGQKYGTGVVKNMEQNNTNKEDLLNKYKYTPTSKKFAELLYSLIKEQNPAWYVEPNFEQWAADIEKIHRIDKRTYRQIEFTIRWAQNDNFWRKNILSPAKLRKQFNTLVIQITNQHKSKPTIV